MKKIKNLVCLVKTNMAIRFILSVMFLFIAWEVIYSHILFELKISTGLCSVLGESAAYLFSLFGYRPVWNPESLYLSLDHMPVLFIGKACNGLEFFGLFACFVLAFPARLKSKAIFLPLGIVLIHVLNTVRVMLLVYNYYYYNNLFDFNHKVTFNVVVYGVVLLLWLYWAKKQSLRANQNA